MAKKLTPVRKGKKKSQGELGVIVDLAHTINDTFEVLTGKTIPEWLKEFQQQPRELPGGEQATPRGEPAMPRADAYAVLGLPQSASLEEVKRNYRSLAAVFHPDKGGYTEAMILLNRAYEQIMSQKKGVK